MQENSTRNKKLLIILVITLVVLLTALVIGLLLFTNKPKENNNANNNNNTGQNSIPNSYPQSFPTNTNGNTKSEFPFALEALDLSGQSRNLEYIFSLTDNENLEIETLRKNSAKIIGKDFTLLVSVAPSDSLGQSEENIDTVTLQTQFSTELIYRLPADQSYATLYKQQYNADYNNWFLYTSTFVNKQECANSGLVTAEACYKQTVEFKQSIFSMFCGVDSITAVSSCDQVIKTLNISEKDNSQ